MVVLETQFKQRAFDGKWIKYIRTMDLANRYSYTNELGNKVSYIPETWIITGIYDYVMTLELEDGSLY